MTDPHNVSWHELSSLVENLVYQLEKTSNLPTVVLAISRGGLVPGVMVSHKLEIPLIPMRWSTRDFLHKDAHLLTQLQQEIERGETILILDDICDTGTTFAQISEHLRTVSPDQVIWASLHVREGTEFEPDHYAKRVMDDGWVVYPYE